MESQVKKTNANHPALQETPQGLEKSGKALEILKRQDTWFQNLLGRE